MRRRVRAKRMRHPLSSAYVEPRVGDLIMITIEARVRACGQALRKTDVQVAVRISAQRRLGWKPEVSFERLVKMMVDADLAALSKGTGAAPTTRTKAA